MSKKRFGLVLMGTVAAAVLASCGQPQPQGFATDQPTRVCVDRDGMRVDDERRCDRTARTYYNPLYRYYYVGNGGYVPAAGYRVQDGSYNALANTNYQTAATAERTAVARGGFGTAGSRNATVTRGGIGGSAHASAGG